MGPGEKGGRDGLGGGLDVNSPPRSPQPQGLPPLRHQAGKAGGGSLSQVSPPPTPAALPRGSFAHPAPQPLPPSPEPPVLFWLPPEALFVGLLFESSQQPVGAVTIVTPGL